MIKSFLNKFKYIFMAIGGFFSFLLFLFIRGKITSKEKLNYELDSVRREIQKQEFDKNIQENNEIIESLKTQELIVREKIKVLEDEESKGVVVPVEELKDFFKSRGF